jgi:FlaG/FlaF family flagellin (archaellin)
MENLSNKHIVLIILVIIIGVFIYNFDVYVVSKGEPICKPIFITKREISPEIRAELNKTEQAVRKETFDNLNKDGYFEQFSQMPDNVFNHNKLFSNITFTNLTDSNKIKVIDSVNKILAIVPTNFNEEQVNKLMQYLTTTYQNSSSLDDFYSKIYENAKNNTDLPVFNSKYTHLILYLIGKFDNSYTKSNLIQQIITKTENNKPSDVVDVINVKDVIKSENVISETLDTSPKIKQRRRKIKKNPSFKQVSFDLHDTSSNVSRINSGCGTKCDTGCSLTLGVNNMTRTNDMIQMNQNMNNVNQMERMTLYSQMNNVNNNLNQMENFSQMNNMNNMNNANNFNDINQIGSFNDMDFAGFAGF